MKLSEALEIVLNLAEDTAQQCDKKTLLSRQIYRHHCEAIAIVEKLYAELNLAEDTAAQCDKKC